MSDRGHCKEYQYKQCKQCKHCKQYKQCRQCTSTVLHLWWYFFFKVNVFKGFNNHQTCPHQDLRNWSCLSWFCFLHAFNINCSRGKEKWDLFVFFCIFYLPPYFYLKRTREMRSHCFFCIFHVPPYFLINMKKTSSDCCPLQRCDLDGDGKLNYDEFIRCHFVIFIGPESYHWLPYSLTYLLTHSLTYSFNSLTNSLLFSRLDWCDPGVWRCQLKNCWGCYCS